MILISIYFIRAYAGKKQSVLQIMNTEANLIENAFITDINYAEYFLNLMIRQIGKKYNNLNYINKVLQENASNYDSIVGWRKYSWVDSNFQERVTSTYGIQSNPKEINFIKEMINKAESKNKITFHFSKNNEKNSSLKLFINIINKFTHKYCGSVLLSYDIATIIRRLEASKRKNYVNFVILDQDLNIVAQSKPLIDHIIDQDMLSTNLKEVTKRIDFSKSQSKEISYIDMITGINYYIRKINNLPFVFIISINDQEIKGNILDSVIKKFIEVAIFVIIFLVIVLSIYRRETWLRSKAEQAMIMATKATKAKSDFLAYTAHEIRSPLGFIVTGSEVMHREMLGNLPEAYKDYADGIHQSSRLILEFITDILDENQIIEGKFKIVNSSVNIEDVINKAIKVNKIRFNDRKVEIIFTPQVNLPYLICDSKRIVQVISNLISNSIKYSKDHTKVTILAEIKAYQLEISIIDEGIGMTEEEIQKALDNSEPALIRSHNLIESYGLGLSIVKMLLDAHSAKLSIESKLNFGTEVKIIFPKYQLIYRNRK